MAKRFIDTGLFDDTWFMELSKDAKIFWIYCFTKCDHAGIIELNERLFKFQTGLNSLQTVIEQLGNRLVRVNERYFFIPKFIDFQYPNFPNSNVKAQKSAIERLQKFNIDINNIYTVIKPLDKCYEYEYGNGYDNENEIYKKFKHLKLTNKEFNKLQEKGFTKDQIDEILLKIQNYKKNSKYESLYLTSLDWLKREYKPLNDYDI